MFKNDRDLVLVVAQEIGEVITPVQLQAAVFLVVREELEGLRKPRYRFRPFLYRPFCNEICTDAEELHEQGLVLCAPSRNGPWTDTIVTPRGSQKAEELKVSLPASTIDTIGEIASSAISLSFQDLARHTYGKYPELAESRTILRAI